MGSGGWAFLTGALSKPYTLDLGSQTQRLQAGDSLRALLTWQGRREMPNSY